MFYFWNDRYEVLSIDMRFENFLLFKVDQILQDFA